MKDFPDVLIFFFRISKRCSYIDGPIRNHGTEYLRIITYRDMGSSIKTTADLGSSLLIPLFLPSFHQLQESGRHWEVRFRGYLHSLVSTGCYAGKIELQQSHGRKRAIRCVACARK